MTDMLTSTQGLEVGQIITMQTAAPNPTRVKVKTIYSDTDLDVEYLDARGGTAAISIEIVYKPQ